MVHHAPRVLGPILFLLPFFFVDRNTKDTKRDDFGGHRSDNFLLISITNSRRLGASGGPSGPLLEGEEPAPGPGRPTWRGG